MEDLADSTIEAHPSVFGTLKSYVLRFAVVLQTFTCFMPISAWFFTVFLLSQQYKDEPFTYWFGIFYMTATAGLYLLSYLRCLRQKSHTILGRPVPNFESMRNSHVCQKCVSSSWKPDRAHHCSICDRCVRQMDHHCPLVGTCIGYENHKSFFLFCFYLLLGGSFFVYRSYIYYHYLKTLPAEERPHQYMLKFWRLISMTTIPFALMGTTMTVSNLILAISNLTTIEWYGGAMPQLPCFPSKSKAKNPYHIGKLANINEFFHNTALLWWWPTDRKDLYNGYRPKTVPLCSRKEYETMIEKLNVTVVEELDQGEEVQINSTLRVIDADKLLKQASDMVKGKVLHHNGEPVKLSSQSSQE